MEVSCPLCSCSARTFFQNSLHHFYLCSECFGIFRDSNQFLKLKDEKSRYLHHRNDMEDKGYHQFILPIINVVSSTMTKGSHGLDFGCGHEPVLSNYLSEEGFKMSIFDPIFFNQESVFTDKYDFIVSCEVIEHFHHPFTEFKKLFNVLGKGGHLICKTHVFSDDIQFESWYYKNDPTHVFIYQEKTMHWIKNKFNLNSVEINKRVITFIK